MPAVERKWLLLIAGLIWMAVGTMLDAISYSWLMLESRNSIALAALAGIATAMVIHHFGFLRVVDKNLRRILPENGTRCVFAFISWKSYLMIAVMILLGSLLRHSPIPRLYLSVLYTGIGTALMLSSVRYFRYFKLSWKTQT